MMSKKIPVIIDNKYNQEINEIVARNILISKNNGMIKKFHGILRHIH